MTIRYSEKYKISANIWSRFLIWSYLRLLCATQSVSEYRTYVDPSVAIVHVCYSNSSEGGGSWGKWVIGGVERGDMFFTPPCLALMVIFFLKITVRLRLNASLRA